MPLWAQRYGKFVGLPAFAVFAISFLVLENPFSHPIVPMIAFGFFFSAGAIRGYFMLHAMGRGEL